MSDQEEDIFGGAVVSDESSGDEERPSRSPPQQRERVVLPRCPDVVGEYQRLSTMRLPTMVQTVREPYTREGFLAAKRGRGPLKDPEGELLAIRWRRVDGRVESNARLVHWSDGTAQLIVGRDRALDVTPRAGSSLLHVSVAISPSARQDLGYPTVSYVAKVPRETRKRRRRLMAASKAAQARAAAAADEGHESDRAEDHGHELFGDKAGSEQSDDEHKRSDKDDEDDDDDDDRNNDDDDDGDSSDEDSSDEDDDDEERARRRRKKKKRGEKHMVSFAFGEEDVLGAGEEQSQKHSLAEQRDEYNRKLAAKNERLRRRAGGNYGAEDLEGSDSEGSDHEDDAAAARLQRAKHQGLHGRGRYR